MKKSITYFAILIVGILLGIIANRNREYLINAQFIRDHWHFRPVLKNKSEIINSDNVMVCLTLGQSNAANYGNGTYSCKNQVYNYYKGDLFVAKEPLLGPDGSGCSVWTRMADLLIDSGLYKKVVIVPIGIGSTSVDCWAEGDCKEKLIKTLSDLKKDNIKLTHVLWDQGETDNVDKTTKEQYKIRLRKVIKIISDQQPDAIFYSSITSYFPYNNSNDLGINKIITSAQLEVVNNTEKLKRGPNTDSLNLAYYRADAVHFTEEGLNKFALEWFKKIRSNN